jgi:hypothetical protein
MTQRELAERFRCSQAQICHDLRAVKRDWRRMMGEEKLADLKAELLEQLDALRSEGWRGWRRSLRPAKRASVKTAGKRTTQSVETRPCDPRFLETIRMACRAVCEMLGLDAPRRAATTTPGGGPLPPLSFIQFAAAPSENVHADGQPVEAGSEGGGPGCSSARPIGFGPPRGLGHM